MSLMADPGFMLLLDRLRGHPLPSLEMYKDRCLQRRLAVRMRACGVTTLTDYAAALDRVPGERERLLAALTINVTQFFRNPEAWHALGEAVPRRSGQPLAGWSAGCASGEEAFTLAMLLAATLPHGGHPAGAFRIDATDVDTESVAAAAAARYPGAAFSEAPPDLVARWTIADGPDRRIGEPLRSAVTVLRHDLGRDPPPRPPYDVIVCRNVLIYFARETQERLLLAFAEALRPGGLLMLGKVESLPAVARDRYETVVVRERLFRKVG